MYSSTTVSLPVKNLAASASWYRDLLGDLETVEPAPGIMEFKLNEVTWLQIFESEDGFGGGNIMRIETNDIAKIQARVAELAPNVTDIIEVPGVIKYFDFSDPSQNQFSVYELI